MCTAIPPSRGVAPGPAIPCGKAKVERDGRVPNGKRLGSTAMSGLLRALGIATAL